MSAKCHVCGFDNDSASGTCSECGVSIDTAAQFVGDEDFDESFDEPVDEDVPPDEVVDESSHESSNDTGEEISDLTGVAVVVVPEQALTVVPDLSPVRIDEELQDELSPEISPTVCPSCMADVDEADFYCSICGVNIRTYVSEADLMQSKAVVTEPGRKTVFRLSVVTGHDKGVVHSFSRPEALLGRALDNDVVLASDGYTSGRHSRVFEEEGEFFLEDLGSTNGTFLRVREKIQLKAGDEIKIGQSIFLFDDTSE